MLNKIEKLNLTWAAYYLHRKSCSKYVGSFSSVSTCLIVKNCTHFSCLSTVKAELIDYPISRCMDLMRQKKCLSFVPESAMKKTPERSNPRLPVTTCHQYIVATIVTDGVTLDYWKRLPAMKLFLTSFLKEFNYSVDALYL